MDNDMVVGLDKLSAKINADFCKFMGNLKEGDYDRNKARIREFNSKLQFKIGKKYIKFTTDRSVWGFVVLQDDDKFFRGDILKPAGHSAPARNFARGNILNGQFGSIQWMGAA
jgi:hypothetical protein